MKIIALSRLILVVVTFAVQVSNVMPRTSTSVGRARGLVEPPYKVRRKKVCSKKKG